MKRTVSTLMFLLGCLALTGVTKAEEAPQKILDLANGELARHGSDARIVMAVQNQNGKNISLSHIKEMDEKWTNTPGIAAFMKTYMENDCARHLKSIQNSAPYYSEIFVMDNQGANVCQTNKTSDYWQGDEAKFQKSYAGGAGAVFVDEVEFDESSQAYLVQVSVPVTDDGGKAIGAITFGIDVDKVE